MGGGPACGRDLRRPVRRSGLSAPTDPGHAGPSCRSPSNRKPLQPRILRIPRINRDRTDRSHPWNPFDSCSMSSRGAPTLQSLISCRLAQMLGAGAASRRTWALLRLCGLRGLCVGGSSPPTRVVAALPRCEVCGKTRPSWARPGPIRSGRARIPPEARPIAASPRDHPQGPARAVSPEQPRAESLIVNACSQRSRKFRQESPNHRRPFDV